MAEIGTDILKAKYLLEQGELVAIPTETVYGLAGNALNGNAVAKIFEVKDRPTFDPLIVHVSSLYEVGNYANNIPHEARALASAFWPGPLTLLVEKKPVIPDLVTAGLPTVGLRCPNHPLTRSLLESIDFPLAAPSANPFGYVSPTTPQHVQDQLGSRIRYILDGGPCEVGIESTIVAFSSSEISIQRLGGLSVEAIESVIGPVSIRISSSSNPKAPGQLESHYAPNKKILIGDLNGLLTDFDPRKVGILSFKKPFPHPYAMTLSADGSIPEAAQNFFSWLRILDSYPIDTILAEYVPNEGLGRAINDRLKRAAAIR